MKVLGYLWDFFWAFVILEAVTFLPSCLLFGWPW
jgi:hypothetical protein